MTNTITIHVDDLDRVKAEQLALLPPFEGRRPSAAQVRLTGSVDTPCRAMRIGEEVVLVVRAAVAKVTHEQDGEDGPLNRVHGLKALEICELPGEASTTVLEVGRKGARAIDDLRNGRIPLGGV